MRYRRAAAAAGGGVVVPAVRLWASQDDRWMVVGDKNSTKGQGKHPT